MLKRLFIAVALAFSLCVKAEETCAIVLTDTAATTLHVGDTIVFDTPLERLFSKRWVQSTYIGVPLIAAGVIEMSENNHFRSLRNGFLPSFRNEVDNYLQYSPVAVMYALKAIGVESASSWKKMIVADALSLVIMTSVTGGIKRLANEDRPDGSNDHSFPSGHTATAFMCATMLQKEYGHLSPWVGFGAYGVATATGVMRIMNNRHWMSDVLAGAGMGIIGTEMGYWLADLLFPSQPKSYNPRTIWLVDTDKNPSFFGTYAGFMVPLHRYKIGAGRRLQASTGATFGLEGAYFFNRHWGVGSQMGVADIKYITTDDEETEYTSHSYTAKAGLYFHHDLYQRLFVGGKAMAGATYYPDINGNVMDNPQHWGVVTTVGANVGFRARQHLDFKVSIDYDTFQSPSKEKKRTDGLVLSGSANIRF